LKGYFAWKEIYLSMLFFLSESLNSELVPPIESLEKSLSFVIKLLDFIAKYSTLSNPLAIQKAALLFGQLLNFFISSIPMACAFFSS